VESGVKFVQTLLGTRDLLYNTSIISDKDVAVHISFRPNESEF
jgi:hypothetical protein